MRRYLPLVLLTTTLVTVLPALLVAAAAPRHSPVVIGACEVSAVALSIAIATAGAALWKRQPRSRDIVFADLLLWGWVRRCWTERRLSQARDLYDCARRVGPMVSIELLTGLSRTLEARDAYTHGHGQRVAHHAERIARAMHLSATEIARIRAAAAVHDVGKLYTPREILNNPGRLSAAEFDVVKRHAADGAGMLAGVRDPEMIAMVRHHHERIDGHGYPDGLAGSDIPVGARIIAVADTFDAITSSRAYRRAGTQKQALDVLSAGAGTQLDADAVAAFRLRYSGRRSVGWLAVATAVSQRAFAALGTASQSFGAGAGGVTSLLPALGAAGLLGLSAGAHARSTVEHTQRLPVLTRSGRSVSASSTLRSRHVASRTAHPALPGTHVQHKAAHASPIARVFRPAASSTPTTRATGTGTGVRVPAAPAPPSTSSPPPSAPPVKTPPLPEGTTVPPPTGTSPVTLPSVPGVNLPPVPSVNVPPVTVTPPSVPLPSTPAAGLPRTATQVTVGEVPNLP